MGSFWYWAEHLQLRLSFSHVVKDWGPEDFMVCFKPVFAVNRVRSSKIATQSHPSCTPAWLVQLHVWIKDVINLQIFYKIILFTVGRIFSPQFKLQNACFSYSLVNGWELRVLSPYGKPLAFCRIRPQSAVVLCTVYIFRITMRYFWVEDFLGKTGGVPAFLVQKKKFK